MRLPNFHAHAPDLSQHRFKGLNKFKDKNRFLRTGQPPSLVLFLLKRLQQSYEFSLQTESSLHNPSKVFQHFPHLDVSSNSGTLKNTIFFQFLESFSLEYLEER